MKTTKMLTHLLGEVMTQRDLAISERDESRHEESAMAMLMHAAEARVTAMDRDYPLRLLRDATGLEWAWIHLHEGRCARALVGEDSEYQMEVYERDGVWHAARTYYPPKPADAGRRSPYGQIMGRGEGATAGEAICNVFAWKGEVSK